MPCRMLVTHCLTGPASCRGQGQRYWQPNRHSRSCRTGGRQRQRAAVGVHTCQLAWKEQGRAELLTGSAHHLAWADAWVAPGMGRMGPDRCHLAWADAYRASGKGNTGPERCGWACWQPGQPVRGCSVLACCRVHQPLSWAQHLYLHMKGLLELGLQVLMQGQGQPLAESGLSTPHAASGQPERRGELSPGCSWAAAGSCLTGGRCLRQLGMLGMTLEHAEPRQRQMC